MKVTPHPVPPQAPHAPGPVLKDQPGSKSFADCLSGSRNVASSGDAPTALTAPMSPQQQRDNVFSFGFLGMFGRYGCQQRPGAGQTESETRIDPAAGVGGDDAGRLSRPSSYTGSPDTMPALNAAEAAHQVLAPQSAIVANPGTAEPAQAMPALTGEGPAFRELLQTAAGSTGPVQSDQALWRSVVPEGPEKMFAAADTGNFIKAGLSESKDGAAAVNLLISGADNALSIVARGTYGAENHVRLRRMVEDTAAEFGMQVSDFRFNGSAPQLFIPALGNNHGNRTR